MPTAASGSRSRIALAQCAAARISSFAPGCTSSRASPAAPSGAWFSTCVPARLQRLEQRNTLRLGAVEAIDDQVPGRAEQPALQQEPQLVAQTRNIEDGLASAEVDERLAPSQKGTPLLAHRVAAQRLGQSVSADDPPGLARGLGQRLPVQQRAFMGGLGNHALPQGELLLRGQQQG